MRITLKESLDHSATEAYLQSKDWPAEVFSQAVAHHLKQGLRANLSTGEVRSNSGWVSRFSNYNWQADYEGALNLVYYDFFRGMVGNSRSRIVRGLAP